MDLNFPIESFDSIFFLLCDKCELGIGSWIFFQEFWSFSFSGFSSSSGTQVRVGYPNVNWESALLRLLLVQSLQKLSNPIELLSLFSYLFLSPGSAWIQNCYCRFLRYIFLWSAAIIRYRYHSQLQFFNWDQIFWYAALLKPSSRSKALPIEVLGAESLLSFQV